MVSGINRLFVTFSNSDQLALQHPPLLTLVNRRSRTLGKLGQSRLEELRGFECIRSRFNLQPLSHNGIRGIIRQFICSQTISELAFLVALKQVVVPNLSNYN